MPSPGLSRGARLLRRWRAHSDIRRVHPWRSAVALGLWYPCCVLALLMYGLAWIGRRLSGIEADADIMRGTIREWYQPTREYDLRRRAYLAWNRRAGEEKP